MSSHIRLKHIFELVGPNIIAQATVILVGFIDLFFISKAGIGATAAISIANIAASTLYNFLDGFKTSATVLIARFLGAQEHENIAGAIHISLLYSLVMGLLVALLAYPISTLVYDLTIHDQAIREVGSSYLFIRLLAAPFTLLLFSMSGIFFGFKNTINPLFITLTVCLFDGGLDYVFIYGKCGFPAMGVKGAAIATLLAYVVGSLVGFTLLLKNRVIRPFLRFNPMIVKSLKRDFFTIAAEVGFYSGFIRIAIFIFATIFSRLGIDALAAHQITFQVFVATFMIPKGFSTATTIIVSNFIGEKNEGQIGSTLRRLNVIAFATTLSFNSIVYIFAGPIALFFGSNDVGIIQTATTSIRIVCMSQLFFSLYMVFLGALTAYKDTKFIMYAEFVTEYFIFIPLAYILAITMSYGVLGGYVAFLVWAIVDASCLIARFFMVKRRSRTVIPSLQTTIPIRDNDQKEQSLTESV